MYTGDTTIGLKGRIVFEAPGLISLLAAHRALEEAVLTKQQNRFKPEVARNGWNWCTKASSTIRSRPIWKPFSSLASVASTAKSCSKRVADRFTAVAVRSPHILNAKGATYAQSADWGVEEAEGFIKLFGMSSTLWAEVNRSI